jgi:tripartite-type tricarboxylate transporter receptor subunit TctC
MNRLSRTRRQLLLASLAAPLAGQLHAADAYPTKPIRLVVPYPPGGTSSLICTLLSHKLEAAGITMYTDYKAGAGGNIGVDMVLKAPPDGYTIGFTAMNSFAINPHLTRKLPYDASRDVQFITLIGSVPNVVAVNPSLPVKNLRELIALSKREDLTYASPGVGTSPHLSGEMLAHDAGLKMLHVPYKGEAPALQDVLGGRVQVMMANLTGVAEYIKAGKLRAIAVTSPKRAAILPDVPTVDESGVKGFDTRGYFVLFTARGVPPSVLDRLNRELGKAIDSRDFREQLASVGLDAAASSVEAATALAFLESRKWGEVVARTGTTWD